MTTLVETTDIGSAYHTMPAMYGFRRFAAPGARRFLRIDRDRFGPAVLHNLVFTMECAVDGAPLGALYLGHLANGNIRYRSHRGWESPAYGPGDVFLAVQPDTAWHGDLVNTHLEFVSLDVPLLAQVAETTPGRLAGPLRFTGYQPATPQDARLPEDLRRVRLDQAHRELVAADPEHGSVTAVAFHWGFARPSRFAVYYRRAYGVLPGHTLRH